MTPEQIKRAKRLAEILEITTHDVTDDCGEVVALVGDDGEWFYPEQDKALLWDLQMEYSAQVGSNFVIISTESNVVSKKVSNKSELPAALIDCVIEINGGYDG